MKRSRQRQLLFKKLARPIDFYPQGEFLRSKNSPETVTFKRYLNSYHLKIFRAEKHYSGVLSQQGRVMLDADWNEQLDIEQYRLHTETRDVIGEAGVPKNVNNGNSFKIDVSKNSEEILISKGRIYVGGLLCESEADVNFLKQPYYPNPEQYFSAVTSPPSSPAHGKLQDGTYIAYLDAWQREVNHWDDPNILEPALGGPDTTTRLQTVWQVKLLKLNQDAANATCNTPVKDWDDLTAPSGKLNVQTQNAVTNDPCLLPPSAGYKRLENQLYRIEIQKVDEKGNAAFFKWSRDNATVETLIDKTTGNKLFVADVGKDEVLGFSTGQWVEIVDEITAFNGTPNPLFKISVDPDLKIITLNTSSIPIPNRVADPTKIKKLRRWDQSVAAATADGLPVTNGWTDIEEGIQINFTGGKYRVGDYWLIPARTAIGDVIWQRDEKTDKPIAQSPTGTYHSFCRLAVMTVQNGRIKSIEDCRKIFPPLTEITCCDHKGCCTYTVTPGIGWEKVFGLIKDQEDAHICFQIGEYPLRTGVRVPNKGNLKITGCGPGTKIMSLHSDTALVFDNCKSVTVRDLFAETGIVATDRTDVNKDKNKDNEPNGTLTFLNCTYVQLESVFLRCGSSFNKKSAACITARNDFRTPANQTFLAQAVPVLPPLFITIRDCEIVVGYGQQGILLVNATRATVENNILFGITKVSAASPKLTFPNMLQNRHFRAAVRNRLLNHANLVSSSDAQKIKIDAYGQVVLFTNMQHGLTAENWTNFVLSNRPRKNPANPQELLQHLYKTADKLLLEKKSIWCF